ncbi:glycerate kinase, partial [Candidatus Aerophobetes bacterium]
MANKDLRHKALKIFKAAVEEVDPYQAVKRYLHREDSRLYVGDRLYDLDNFERVLVVGGGKATAPMAKGVEEILRDKIKAGIINVKYKHTEELKVIKINEAGHPIPDEEGMQGCLSILKLLSQTTDKDLVICLISGGGSALLPIPCEGITLEEKKKTTELLLGCGATIQEINAVRKHISRIKGGGLARAAFPSELITLILSDVVGDDLDAIASGPTVPDNSAFSDVKEIFQKYDLLDKLPKSVVRHIQLGIEGKIPETPKRGDSIFQKTFNLIIGSNVLAIRGAEKKAKELGFNTLFLSSFIEGETREVAKVHTAIAKEIISTGNPIPSPACVISGGETTVTVKGDGLGGRNLEFALASGMEID